MTSPVATVSPGLVSSEKPFAEFGLILENFKEEKILKKKVTTENVLELDEGMEQAWCL